MNFQKRLFSRISILIFSLLMMVVLTVPAFAGFQSTGTRRCSYCGKLADLFPNDTYCFYSICSCPFCGKSISSLPLPDALPHEFIFTSASATCTDDGFHRRECTRDGCGAVDLEIIPALGGEHTWEETSRTAATTTASGSIEYTCSTCGDVKYEAIPALSPDPSPGPATGLDGLMTGFEYVVFLFGEVWGLMLSNPLLTLFLAAGLVGLGVRAFRRLRSTARV